MENKIIYKEEYGRSAKEYDYIYVYSDTFMGWLKDNQDKVLNDDNVEFDKVSSLIDKFENSVGELEEDGDDDEILRSYRLTLKELKEVPEKYDYAFLDHSNSGSFLESYHAWDETEFHFDNFKLFLAGDDEAQVSTLEESGLWLEYMKNCSYTVEQIKTALWVINDHTRSNYTVYEDDLDEACEWLEENICFEYCADYEELAKKLIKKGLFNLNGFNNPLDYKKLGEVIENKLEFAIIGGTVYKYAALYHG